MPDRVLWEIFDRLFATERRTLVRYIFEAANPTATESDRPVAEAIDRAHHNSDSILEELRDLALAECHYPPEGHFNLGFAIFNYSDYGRILEAVVPELEAHRDEVARLASALEDWPEAHSVAERLLKSTEEQQRTFKELLDRRCSVSSKG